MPLIVSQAVGVGFEPTDLLQPPVFRTGALDQLCDPTITYSAEYRT